MDGLNGLLNGWLDYVLSMHGWMPERCFLVQLFLGCVIYFPFFYG